MPFTEFCCRSGGSNLNAGTMTGNSTEPGTSALFTYASGNWVSSTGVFTVASGNPSTDGVAVGDFASVYADGASVTTLVGRVTAVSSTTITVSTAAKAGSTSDGTGNRTLKIGGAWQGPNGTSGFPISFVATALTNAAGDLPRINLKNAATYNVTATVATTTTQNSVTIQGYATSYGDGSKATIDGGTTGASYNLWQPVTNKLHVVDIIFQNNGATGNAHGVVPSTNCQHTRCVVHDVRGLGFFGGRYVNCEAYNCNIAGVGGWGGFYSVSHAERCISHHNTGDGFTQILSNAVLLKCIAHANSGVGISLQGSSSVIESDSYHNGSHGIQVVGGSNIFSIVNCNLLRNAGYGMSGSGSPAGVIRNCGFGAGTMANTSGETTGLGGMLVSGNLTYTANTTPWTAPDSGNFLLASGGQAINAGIADFTTTYPSYGPIAGNASIGSAWQQSGGGAGGFPLSRVVN